MSMTAQDRKWMELRDSLTQNEMFVLDDVFQELWSSAETQDVRVAGDDRAASLEAALVRFFIESREK